MNQVNVLELNTWSTPASEYTPAQVGNYRIGKHTYQPGLYSYHGIDGYMLFCATKELRATTLLELQPNRFGTLRWKEWMVDSPPDYRAMQKYAAAARGAVLTSGLGLGLLVHELCKNPDVESITVVEKSKDVVKLVWKYIPQGLIKDNLPAPPIKIVLSDFFGFVNTCSDHFDTIIAGIWVYWGLDLQLEMYRGEILKAYQVLQSRYPSASIVCHGFAGRPTEQQLQQLELTDDITNPLIIDPLIYGLQDKEFNYERRLHANIIG